METKSNYSVTVHVKGTIKNKVMILPELVLQRQYLSLVVERDKGNTTNI